MAEGALSGFRVLDATQNIAGPYCTRLLAGLGAEVIKLEEPDCGDPARDEGPFLNDQPHPETSALFLYLNANKKGITLNIKCETGARIFKELVRQSTVLVENFESQFLSGLGLGYEALKEINPSLVMTSISNFGQTGPYRDFKATEIVDYAMSGLMSLTGEPGEEPLKVGGNIAQYTAGQTACAATIGALFYRETTGIGQHVDVSIMEACAALLEFQMPMFTYMGYEMRRMGNHSEKGHPHGLYPCRDGYVSFRAFPDERWPDLARVMNIPALLDPRFSTRRKQIEHRDEIDALIIPWLTEHTKQEIYQLFQDNRIACGYVRNAEEVLDCPQLKAREYFVEVGHPVAGTLTYPGAPYKLSETPWQVGRAPLLGEHNEQVYGEFLGYSKEDIVLLRQAKVL